MNARARWLGLDFSGSAAQWRRRRTSNVWLAELGGDPGRPRLLAVRPVQQLEGAGSAWDRLVARLRRGDFEACGIDAPFSVPAAFLGARDHPALLRLVAALPCPGRPFATASAFVEAVAGRAPPLEPRKPLRGCEALWRSRGVNVRSTLWAGPRGGAAFTAACLALLAAAARPAWPWDGAAEGRAVETFPAAQLRRWGLPHQRYDGVAGAPARRAIVLGLRARVDLGAGEADVLGSADALDAVLAAFGALAVARDRLADPPAAPVAAEGWIAVHA